MSEQPLIRIKAGEEDIEIRRDNSKLYTFFGELACHNHVFVRLTDEQGHFLFGGDNFPKIVSYMLENGYEADLNARRVPQCDQEAYDAYIGQLVGNIDYLPEAWPQTDAEG